jgi:AcrR family transcriptional regulator
LSRPSARERLLDAAVAVVRRDGAQALTFDAVAAEAGVSKGGLLYHFRSKRDLLDALVERWLDGWQAEMDADDSGDGFVPAYVRTSHLGGAGQAVRADETALLAALVGEPEVLAAVRHRFATWQDRVEREGGDPVDATVARLAADGLWLADLLGLGPPQGAVRDAVLARLLELAGEHD